MTLRRSTRLLGWSLAACAPALAAATTERPLPLVVAVGPEIRADPEWRHDLGRAVAYCQQTLGEAVAGRFRVREVVAWQPRGSTLEQMLASLRRQVPPRPDVLVLGLTRRHAAPENEWGLSSYREALALVTTWRTGGRYGPALAHEIGHLFGAVHVETAGCVMAGASPGARLSPLNAALLRLHRDRALSPHRFPLSPDRLAEALELYRRAAATDPGALALLAQTALEAGDDHGALAAAGTLSAWSEDAQAEMLRGIALRRLGRSEHALEAYSKALSSRPDDADVHYNRGVALEADDDARAEDAYREALRRDDGHVRAMSSLARLLARSGRAPEALELARLAVGAAPDFTPARVNLALAELHAGQPARALEAAESALGLEPECPEAHALQGAALLALGHHDRALAVLERGAALDDASAELLEGLGRARRETGDSAGARSALERALTLDPARASAHVELGLAQLESDRPDDAARSFERAAALEPRRLSAWVNLAAARLLQGRSAESEAACLRALELQPASPRALTTLGLLRGAQGRHAEALELQEQAARREAARELYRRVVARRPGDAHAHNNLAVVLFRLGDVSGAAEHAALAQELGAPVAPGFLRALSGQRASR
jgi:tetratricopeptide (TPR) repeat protein